MGLVVAARHREFHDRVAIKFLLPTFATQEHAVARLLREAQVLAGIGSEHVVRIFDVGKLENGAPYIVMEHLEGRDLFGEIKCRGLLPIAEAVRYVLQACEVLAEAHRAGVIHRDLKPANLFLTRRPNGSPCIKVLDFGISKVNDFESGEAALTGSHDVLGSPHYMSPEQMLSPHDVDARADIWSLGIILYLLVTGQRPFHGKSAVELICAVRQDKPRPIADMLPDDPLAPALDAVILRCLEKDVRQRMANVADLARALLPFAPLDAQASVGRIVRRLQGADAPPWSEPILPVKRCARARIIAGAVVAVLFSVLGFVLGLRRRLSDQNPKRHPRAEDELAAVRRELSAVTATDAEVAAPTSLSERSDATTVIDTVNVTK